MSEQVIYFSKFQLIRFLTRRGLIQTVDKGGNKEKGGTVRDPWSFFILSQPLPSQ